MYAHDLFENPKPRVVVTYPGRFQPFHQGHAGVFAQLQKKFGNENVFIATSNDTSSAKSPFNFSDKYQLMTAAGVPGNNIFETNSMYSLPNDFNPASTVFVTAVGAPDADRLNPDSYLKRDRKDKDGNVIKPAGSPGYYKTWNPSQTPVTADQHGYVIVIPEIHKDIKINGQQYNVSHGTDCRNLWTAIRGDEEARKSFLKQLYGKADKHLADIFDKIPAATQEDIDQRAADTTSPIHGGVKKGTAGLVSIEESLLNELRILHPADKRGFIDVYYKPESSLAGERRVVAKNIPYNALDLLTKAMIKKFGISPNDLIIEPVDAPYGERLSEFASDDNEGPRKFIPWTEFIEQLKQILHKDFSCKENIVKSTIKARFVPHDPMEYGPTMLYSYYETRGGGRNKGAVSTRGSIQVGKYTKGGLFGQAPDQLLTGFHLLKGTPFERHFDLTFENIYKIANIIQGNTEGALEFKPEGIAEGFDKEAFRRHMADLEAREELRKTDPVSVKALDLRGQLPKTVKKKPEDDSININDPRHSSYGALHNPLGDLKEGFNSKQEVIDHFVKQGKPAAAGAAAWERGWRGPKAKTPATQAPKSPQQKYWWQDKDLDEDAAGVGVVATNKKMAKDPRYSMSITQDVKPSTPKNQLRAFRLSETWTNKYIKESINPEDFHVKNINKLDVILSYLCRMVIEGKKLNKDLFGMVAACVLDPDNRAVFGINYYNDATDNRVHAERCALDQYTAQYGEPPAGSIIITTLSPCCHPMEERYGESCTELINDTDIHKVYCGYKDPTQDEDMNRTFHIKQTRNADIIELCKSFADTFLNNVNENFADGRHPEDKGDSKRLGVPTKASVSTLRKVAKQGGRKGQLAHWMANMKAGRAKANENIDATTTPAEPDFPAILAKFLPIAMKDLGIDKLPKIKLEKHIESHDGQATFGRFVNDVNEIHLAIADRHPIDILRTLAHELTHFRQHIRNELEHDSGETGSPEENEAHIMAGIIMRHFDKAYPDLLKLNPLNMD